MSKDGIKNKNVDGSGKVIPPVYVHVEIYFVQAGSNILEATAFYDHYDVASWRNSNGRVISNWKVYAWKWIWYG